MKNLKNMTELNNNELMTIEGGYSWKEFGSDIGYAAGVAADFAHGVIDGFTGKDC